MPQLPPQGSVALVCYVPEPLCTHLKRMREDLPSAYDAEPHITVLPPRPLHFPLEELTSHLLGVLNGFARFAIGLTGVSSFSETNLLYLRVCRGSDDLRRLHSALNQGNLRHKEIFDFTPHLTIAGPFDSGSLPERLQDAEALWAPNAALGQFEAQELALLRLPHGGHRKDWQPHGSFNLAAGVRSERGFAATATNR